MKQFLLAAAFLVGCGSDDDAGITPVPDVAASETATVDSAVTMDSTAADSAIVDSAVVDSAMADTMSMPATEAGAMKRGQCYQNSHCPSGDCRAGAPGGICGCTGACSASDFNCGSFGACVLDCAVDADCFAGMRCTSNGCALRTCASDATCPSTTVCRALTGGSTKYCQRKLCPDGTGCPATTTCLTTAEGKSCVENSLEF